MNPPTPRGRWNQSGLEQRLGPTILCVARILERQLVRAMSGAGLDLTPAQARILITLHFHAPLTQQELASRIDIEPSTLVGTLDVMERDGLARREPNPADRRAHLVSSTEKGEALVPRLFGLWEGVEENLHRALSERERQSFLRLLSKMTEALWEGESC